MKRKRMPKTFTLSTKTIERIKNLSEELELNASAIIDFAVNECYKKHFKDDSETALEPQNKPFKESEKESNIIIHETEETAQNEDIEEIITEEPNQNKEDDNMKIIKDRKNITLEQFSEYCNMSFEILDEMQEKLIEWKNDDIHENKTISYSIELDIGEVNIFHVYLEALNINNDCFDRYVWEYATDTDEAKRFKGTDKSRIKGLRYNVEHLKQDSEIEEIDGMMQNILGGC